MWTHSPNVTFSLYHPEGLIPPPRRAQPHSLWPGTPGLGSYAPHTYGNSGGLNFPKVQEINYGAKRGDNSGSLGRGELVPRGVQQLHSLLGKTSSFNFRLDLNRITFGCETLMNMEQQERIIGKRQPRWLAGLIVRYATLDPTSRSKGRGILFSS